MLRIFWFRYCASGKERQEFATDDNAAKFAAESLLIPRHCGGWLVSAKW